MTTKKKSRKAPATSSEFLDSLLGGRVRILMADGSAVEGTLLFHDADGLGVLLGGTGPVKVESLVFRCNVTRLRKGEVPDGEPLGFDGPLGD